MPVHCRKERQQKRPGGRNEVTIHKLVFRMFINSGGPAAMDAEFTGSSDFTGFSLQYNCPRLQGCQMVYFQCLAMKDVGKFYGCLIYFTYIQPFRIFYGHLVYFAVILVYFLRFWYVVPRKIWQPCPTPS
jgi:hypothetical protein